MNPIVRDLAAACRPVSITVTLDYRGRSGLHTVAATAYTAG